MSFKEVTETINMGNTVLCDLCNEDYTGSEKRGGFLFCSKAVCPACAPQFEARVRFHNEQHLIADRARPDETFAEFVYRLRGGQPGLITITSFERE